MTKKLRLNTTQTTADGKLTHALWAFVIGTSCSYQRLLNVYLSFKRRNRNKDIQDKRRYTKYKQSNTFNNFKRLMLWKYLRIGMIWKDHVTFKQPSVCTVFIHMLVSLTFALILGTDSFAKLNIQSELTLSPSAPMANCSRYEPSGNGTNQTN